MYDERQLIKDIRAISRSNATTDAVHVPTPAEVDLARTRLGELNGLEVVEFIAVRMRTAGPMLFE